MNDEKKGIPSSTKSFGLGEIVKLYLVQGTTRVRVSAIYYNVPEKDVTLYQLTDAKSKVYYVTADFMGKV